MIAAENAQNPGPDHVLTTAPAEAGLATMDRFAHLDQRVLGTVLFIASETVFFAILILTYIFYRSAPAVANGPNASTAVELMPTAIFTICLFASSGTIWLADRSLARGYDTGVRLWLFATFALGAIFLGGQGMEYAHLLSNNITIDRNLFGTTFFTLTGFHGFHVLGGLIALLILFSLAVSGQFKGKTHNAAISSVSLYWHFVDGVWVFVFSIVYIWPNLVKILQ